MDDRPQPRPGARRRAMRWQSTGRSTCVGRSASTSAAPVTRRTGWRSRAAPGARPEPRTATLLVKLRGDIARARAWAPVPPRALARLETLLGLDDDPSALVPQHDAVAAAVRRVRGLRIGRSGGVIEALVPAILEQKVTGAEHGRTCPGSMRQVRRTGARWLRLRLQPDPGRSSPGCPTTRSTRWAWNAAARRASCGPYAGRRRGWSAWARRRPVPGRRSRHGRPPMRRCGRSPGSGRGRPRRSGSGRSVTRTR